LDDNNRQQLPGDSEPPELDKKKQVLPIGYLVNIGGNRPAPRLRGRLLSRIAFADHV
jgi:hypothetical protein